MKKVVLKVDIHDDRQKKKALTAVSSLPGIESISIDMKENKLTVIGDVDPVSIVHKLRKITRADIDSVGPAKEEKKKEDGAAGKEGGGKGDGAAGNSKKGADPTAEMNKQLAEMVKAYQMQAYQAQAYNYDPGYNSQYAVRSWEENPNACVIC